MSSSSLTWNKLRTNLTVTLAVVVVTTYLTTFDSHPLTAALSGALVIAVVIGGVMFETTLALIIALVAAGIIIATQQAVGTWTAEELLLDAARLALLFAAALAGRRLSKAFRRVRESFSTEDASDPALGSLGLLKADYGEARLAEEIERARQFKRPLSVLRVETHLDADRKPPQVREGATRAVARTLESVMFTTDVLYAHRENVVIGILPETSAEQIRIVEERVTDILRRASFLTRPDNERNLVLDHADILIGCATLHKDGQDVDELVDATKAHLNPVPRVPDAGGHPGAADD